MSTSLKKNNNQLKLNNKTRVESYRVANKVVNVTVDNIRAALARRLQTKVLIERPNQRIGRIQSAASLGHKRKRNR